MRTLEELREAAEAGRLREVPGIGPKMEAKLRAALAREPQRGPTTGATSQPGSGADRASRGRDRRRAGRRSASLQGPLRAPRRRRSGVDPGPTIARFEELPQIVALVEREERRAVGVTVEGVAVELFVPPPEAAGTALIRATGAPAYVEALEPLPDGASEEEVYERLGIPWCPPSFGSSRSAASRRRSSSAPTSAATSTATRPGRTVAGRSRRWAARRWSSATSTSRSAITPSP